MLQWEAQARGAETLEQAESRGIYPGAHGIWLLYVE